MGQDLGFKFLGDLMLGYAVLLLNWRHLNVVVAVRSPDGLSLLVGPPFNGEPRGPIEK